MDRTIRNKLILAGGLVVLAVGIFTFPLGGILVFLGISCVILVFVLNHQGPVSGARNYQKNHIPTMLNALGHQSEIVFDVNNYPEPEYTMDDFEKMIQ